MSKMRQSTKSSAFASRTNRTFASVCSMSRSHFSKRSIANISQSRRSMVMSEIGLGESKVTGGIRLGIAVLDEDGNDVTPKPLYAYEPTPHKSQLFGTENPSAPGTPTDTMSFSSFYPNPTPSYAQPFTRSIYGSPSSRSMKSKKSSMESSDEISDSGAEVVTGFADVITVRKDEVEELTEEDLNMVVDVILEETDTIWMFEHKGTVVSADSEEKHLIETKNRLYEELCKTKEGNDRFAERGMQTFNDEQKHKDIQAEKVGLVDVGVNVTSWDMFDTFVSTLPPVVTESSDESLVGKVSRGSGTGRTDSDDSIGTSRVTESRASLVAVGDHDAEYNSIAADQSISIEESGDNPQWEAVIKGNSIKHHLVVMERVVTENVYQPKQAAYRGLEVLIDPDKGKSDEEAQEETPPVTKTAALGPTLDRLWSYSCSITKGRNVASMAWNKLNVDILAVGYGQFGFSEQTRSKGGLACCWNFKNPEYPERVFHCKSSVTAVDFSSTNPNLLAVGQFDGTVCIYNVRNSADAPVVDSFDCSGKHCSPVWQLCWIEREKGMGDERGESLVSISADGRIVQWSIRKGFECSDLMKLKRTGNKNPQKKKEKAEAFISRQAPGMCFDFHRKDTNMYLAGTEEGLIHKCSCSYNEQFLDTFSGHTGPIYKVKWSPFSSDIFLSCSADWSIRLWIQSLLKPVLNFFSTTKVVHDICWSPYSPTVFCAVNEGAVEVWDLNSNTLDPLILHLAGPGIKLSCSIFSGNSNSILVGDSDGQVSVYQLKNMPSPPVPKKKSKANMLTKIVDSTLSNQTENKHGEKKGH